MGANSKDFQEAMQEALNTATASSIATHDTQQPMINKITSNAKTINVDDLSPGRRRLTQWLGKTFRVVISDGRVLVGFFNCTDKDANIVLSMCAEYLEDGKDARILGNVMIPGKHIVSISVDLDKNNPSDNVANGDESSDSIYT
ncbi:N-alpha-acetyltransferase 38, NatC auxiliary subunit [Teleopsis dalmanni]|uniref:N-alpha-acetyltransferase 38, NatC auxiliary subunit n=1 Tax=Teleopsis dalmanni TaxID=139649 RepID=UPI000D32A5BA|nr:N-alpha-acetyltransferase 38, NatC auxiliary subunit [Teleopsis dalmanni]